MSDTQNPGKVATGKAHHKQTAKSDGSERDGAQWRNQLSRLYAKVNKSLRASSAHKTANNKKNPEEKLITPARSAAHAAWAAAVLAFFSLGAFIYLSVRTEQTAQKAARAASDTVIIMNRQSEMMFNDERPWIKIDPEVREDLKINTSDLAIGAVNILMSFKLTNTGKTPAFLIVPVWDTDDISGRDIAAWQASECDKFKADERTVRSSVVETIFPGQTIPFPMIAQLSSDKIKRAIEYKRHIFRRGYQPGFRPVIFGCMNYKTSLDQKWHQTWFAYSIEPKGAVDFRAAPMIVPKNQLQIWAVPAGPRALQAN